MCNYYYCGIYISIYPFYWLFQFVKVFCKNITITSFPLACFESDFSSTSSFTNILLFLSPDIKKRQQ